MDRNKVSILLRSVVILAILGIPFFILVQFEEYLEPLVWFAGAGTHALFQILGFKTQFNPPFLFFGTKGLSIIPACSGYRSILAFLALVIAGPKKSWKSFMMVPLIYGFNILRLFITLYLFSYFPVYSEFIHDFVWKYSMTLLVFLLWWYSLKLVPDKAVKLQNKRVKSAKR